MDKVVIATVIDDTLTLSAEEFCGRTHLTAADLKDLVDTGIITPLGRDLFTQAALRRARHARRLKYGLDVEWETVAVLLDLLQEIDSLRQRLGALEPFIRP